MARLIRYLDLKARGIVSNRMTLRRWIAEEGFPAGVQLGPNSVAWPEDEINAWVKSRSRASKREVAA
jgi:predicted DNA-binding transcriptional regulator AlpA